MKHILIILLVGILILPAYSQEPKNLSLVIDTVEIPASEFNYILRDAVIVDLIDEHTKSWQVTIDNNLLYANPNGNAVLRVHDKDNPEKFVEVGMGSPPKEKFWVAVQIPDDEGYVVVHRDLERGWVPTAKIIVSFTERAGLTVNNGARIVVTNLDIGMFVLDSYLVYGMESSTDPPAINSKSMTVEFLSGDPTQNVFALFPFYITAAVGLIVGVLFLTKRRS